MRVLVIIPAYNEAANIVRVVDELVHTAPELDYIVINDGSKDNTLAILKKHGISHLHLPINLGIGGVVQTGYLYAQENNYDCAVQLDGDGQHDAAQIAVLLKPIVENRADLVIGSRFVSEAGSFRSTMLRRLGIRFISLVLLLCCGQRVHDVTSGFRAVNRPLIAFYAREYAQDYPEPEAILSATLGGFRILEVATVMRERQGGVSSINALSSVYYMVKVTLALLLRRFGLTAKGA